MNLFSTVALRVLSFPPYTMALRVSIIPTQCVDEFVNSFPRYNFLNLNFPKTWFWHLFPTCIKSSVAYEVGLKLKKVYKPGQHAYTWTVIRQILGIFLVLAKKQTRFVHFWFRKFPSLEKITYLHIWIFFGTSYHHPFDWVQSLATSFSIRTPCLFFNINLERPLRAKKRVLLNFFCPKRDF